MRLYILAVPTVRQQSFAKPPPRNRQSSKPSVETVTMSSVIDVQLINRLLGHTLDDLFAMDRRERAALIATVNLGKEGVDAVVEVNVL